MVNYHAVAKTVEPKRKKVAEAEKSLRLASKDLIKTQEEVVQLNTELGTLNKSFSEKSTEQQELKDKADLMERRLTAASKLIVGLSSEQTRWTKDMEMLDARKVIFSFAVVDYGLWMCPQPWTTDCTTCHIQSLQAANLTATRTPSSQTRL